MANFVLELGFDILVTHTRVNDGAPSCLFIYDRVECADDIPVRDEERELQLLKLCLEAAIIIHHFLSESGVHFLVDLRRRGSPCLPVLLCEAWNIPIDYCHNVVVFIEGLASRVVSGFVFKDDLVLIHVVEVAQSFLHQLLL